MCVGVVGGVEAETEIDRERCLNLKAKQMELQTYQLRKMINVLIRVVLLVNMRSGLSFVTSASSFPFCIFGGDGFPFTLATSSKTALASSYLSFEASQRGDSLTSLC